MKLSLKFLPVSLLLVGSLALVTSCAPTDTSNFPPLADLKRTEEAKFDPAQITDENHLDDVQTRRETRGRKYDDQLRRICTFFQEKGMKVDCEAEPDPLNP